MLYHLVKYFSQHFDIPGVGMFLSLSFRAAMAIILALTIGMIFGRKIIRLLQRRQIGEEVRYTQLMIVSTVWLGLIGFLDDYIKVFRKRKEGLSGRYKIVGQVGLGVIVGCAMWLSPQIVVKEKLEGKSPRAQIEYVTENGQSSPVYVTPAEKSVRTTIPFVKNNEFDYHWLIPGDGPRSERWSWIAYVAVAILVITAVSNGANLTDGLDGLASGVSATIVVTLGILAYLSGNVIYADYLNIMYIPSSGELVVYAAAFAGALFGFLWYNCYPAQVFMGDTGSLAIGGIIAVFARNLLRREPVGHFSGRLVQIYEKTLRRGPARAVDGSAASPLSEKRIFRVEDRRAFLDRAVAVGGRYARYA